LLDGVPSSADQRLLGLMRELNLACPHCGYDLRGAASVTCPECGVHIREEDYRRRNSKQPLPKSNWLVMCIVGAASSIVGAPAITVWFVRTMASASVAWPFSLSVFLVGASVAVPGWLTWWLAYRPLRAVALPAGVRLGLGAAMGAMAVLMVGGAAAGMVWSAWVMLR
jgi:predicted RNA-binding Zn-ribbon protein involved in translation (DUF1610 family)